MVSTRSSTTPKAPVKKKQEITKKLAPSFEAIATPERVNPPAAAPANRQKRLKRRPRKGMIHPPIQSDNVGISLGQLMKGLKAQVQLFSNMKLWTGCQSWKVHAVEQLEDELSGKRIRIHALMVTSERLRNKKDEILRGYEDLLCDVFIQIGIEKTELDNQRTRNKCCSLCENSLDDSLGKKKVVPITSPSPIPTRFFKYYERNKMEYKVLK